MKFKKGDKIRRINSNHGILRVGDEAIINCYETNDYTIRIVGDYEYLYDQENFELVESSNQINELPEKWCIKGSLDYGDILLEYFNNIKANRNFWNFRDSFSYYYMNNNNQMDLDERILDGYTEITFEQFKQLILNKNEKSNTKINEVQGSITTNRDSSGSRAVRVQCSISTITIGARLNSNKISLKPSKTRVKESRAKGSILQSVHN